MPNIFNKTTIRTPGSNNFDLTHDHKTTGSHGKLYPVMCLEVLPTDRHTIGLDALLKTQPLIAPAMHRVDVSFHYFFVPNRILWPGWDDFIQSKDNGSGIPSFPTIEMNQNNWTELVGRFGIARPPLPSSDPTSRSEVISALPFSAYQLIYDTYYRDQNLITSQWSPLTNGNQLDYDSLLTIRRRAWEHDYFTSCLPFAQRGAEVQIPLEGLKDVPVYRNNNSGTPTAQIDLQTTQGGINVNTNTRNKPTNSPTVPPNALYADTDTAPVGATNIVELRRAIKIQEWLEMKARSGSRPWEYLNALFGAKTQDARYQLPEYITGVKAPVIISEIQNTTGTIELPQGNRSGNGLGVVSGDRSSFYCPEHGYIICMMSIMPKTAYQQGIPRHFLKYEDNFQYYTPQFAGIGEQTVLNNELRAFTTESSGDFGFLPRYTEYRFMSNIVSGDMASSLDFWHLGRKFENQPALNKEFIECNPSDRIFAVIDDDQDKYLIHILHKINSIRPVAKYGNPMM